MFGVRIAILVAATSLFLLACVSTIGYAEGGFFEGGIDFVGWRQLLFGWSVLTISLLGCLAWLANPAWLVAFICMWLKKDAEAVVFALLGFLLSLIPLLYLVASRSLRLRMESPIALVILPGYSELRLGYFAWVSSFAVLLSGSLLLWYRSRPVQIRDDQPPLDSVQNDTHGFV